MAVGVSGGEVVRVAVNVNVAEGVNVRVEVFVCEAVTVKVAVSVAVGVSVNVEVAVGRRNPVEEGKGVEEGRLVLVRSNVGPTPSPSVGVQTPGSCFKVAVAVGNTCNGGNSAGGSGFRKEYGLANRISIKIAARPASNSMMMLNKSQMVSFIATPLPSILAPLPYFGYGF